jgi:hypothetical protein
MKKGTKTTIEDQEKKKLLRMNKRRSVITQDEEKE